MEPIQKADTIHFIAKAMEDRYVFHDKGQEAAKHLLNELQMGSYDTIKEPENFATALTKDLYKITKDKHIRVSSLANEVAIAPTPNTVEEHTDLHPDLVHIKTYVAPTNVGWLGEAHIDREYRSGFLKSNPDIGYFELKIFGLCNDNLKHLSRFKIPKSTALSEDVKARRAALIAGIQHLKEAKIIIIDMRPNFGGDPSAVQLLCSLFMDEKVPLNRLEWRTSSGFESDHFETLSKEELPHSLRLTNLPLYILGGQNTFSAGESFMNEMKVHKRATLVGASTGGGANPGGLHKINDLFEIFIPSGRAIHPIQQGNWEGVGIIPDHSTKEDHALRTTLELIQMKRLVKRL